MRQQLNTSSENQEREGDFNTGSAEKHGPLSRLRCRIVNKYGLLDPCIKMLLWKFSREKEGQGGMGKGSEYRCLYVYRSWMCAVVLSCRHRLAYIAGTPGVPELGH